MPTFTIFTPTYNRAHTLGRVYNSLLNQTNKDFKWLIIDDGSTDNTKELVEKWKTEKEIDIEYHYKENGGKHTAMKLGWEKARTKYLIGVDSDDELTPKAVDVFFQEWEDIESQGLGNAIAEIRALVIKPNRTIIGNFIFPPGLAHEDRSWHEMVLRRKNNNELISSWNTIKLKECISFNEKIWLSNKINFFSEFVFWARIGRKYKTRYLNKPLLIVHYDGAGSLLRETNQNQILFNNLVGNKYFLDENLAYFFWNPKYFFNLILKFIVSGVALGFSPIAILKEIKTLRFRFVYIICSPFGLFAWLYLKFFKQGIGR